MYIRVQAYAKSFKVFVGASETLSDQKMINFCTLGDAIKLRFFVLVSWYFPFSCFHCFFLKNFYSFFSFVYVFLKIKKQYVKNDTSTRKMLAFNFDSTN